MKSLFDTKISYYRNVEDNVGTEISLRDFLFNDQHKEQIEYIRSISDEDKQKRLKLQLPVATISGTFAPTCKAENLVAHSTLLCIDIDKKDNMDVDWTLAGSMIWSMSGITFPRYSMRAAASVAKAGLPSSALPILISMRLSSKRWDVTSPIAD